MSKHKIEVFVDGVLTVQGEEFEISLDTPKGEWNVKIKNPAHVIIEELKKGD